MTKLEIGSGIGSLPPSECDSNSNSGSVFSRRYPDEISSTNESNENSSSVFGDDNKSDSPSAPVTPEQNTTTLQSRRRQLYAVLAKNPPKITRKDVIDLATEQEKINPDDEWFERRFHQNLGVKRDHPTNLTEVKESLRQHKISPLAARTALQASLAKKLAEKRRQEQQRRKAVYDADNEKDDDKLSSVCDGSESADEQKSEVLEEPEENDLNIEDEDEKPKCDFIEYEADESNSYDENDETIFAGDKSDGKNDGDNVEDDDDSEQTVIISNAGANENEKEKPSEKNDAKNTSKEGEEKGMYWWKDWLEIGLPASSQPYQNENLETTASQISIDELDEAHYDNLMAEAITLCSDFDSDEFSRSSSSSLNEYVLDDLARNCSGTFETMVLDGKKGCQSAKRASMSDDDDGIVPILKRSKPRIRRLVISDEEDDDENNGEREGRNSKSSFNLNMKRHKAGSHESCSSTDYQREFIDAFDKMIGRGEEVADLDSKNRSLFNDVDDNTNADGDESDKNHHDYEASSAFSDTEDQDNKEEGEIDSSDDELEVFRRLQNGQKPKKRLEYIDEEASLSGDDVESDENDDDAQLNVYEPEEGDNDELPDEETIKEQVQKQWLKQQQDEEDRKILYWKDQLLLDGDLAGETDRTFRIKLREVNNEKHDNEVDDTMDDAEDGETDEDKLLERRREIMKLKAKAAKIDLGIENVASQRKNLLLTVGSKIVGAGNVCNQPSKSVESPASRNSLLAHRKTLSQVVDQANILLYATSIGPGNVHANNKSNETRDSVKRHEKELIADSLKAKKMHRSFFDS